MNKTRHSTCKDMESHMLNMYHQARYHNIGHKRMSSNSGSSESSIIETSPDYTLNHTHMNIGYNRIPGHNSENSVQSSSDYTEPLCSTIRHNWTVTSGTLMSESGETNHEYTLRPGENRSRTDQSLPPGFSNQYNSVCTQEDSDSDTDDGWNHNHMGITTHGLVNSIGVQDIYDENVLDEINDTSLVEGDDYEIIQVYTVDPNLNLLEGSSDEEQGENFTSERLNCSDDEEVAYVDESSNETTPHEHKDNRGNDLFNLSNDGPVVSNVDEYFVKPVVKNTTMEAKSESTSVDDFFAKQEESPKYFTLKETAPLPQLESLFGDNDDDKHLATAVPVSSIFVAKAESNQSDACKLPPACESTPISETDTEALPKIERIKNYLMYGTPLVRIKSAQKSWSVPQTPIHGSSSVEFEEHKTRLSLDDLNLSDLVFDDKLENTKLDDDTQALMDEDIKGFLNPSVITTSTTYDDNLTPQDMDLEHPLEGKILLNPPLADISVTTGVVRTSTPLPTLLASELDFGKSIDVKTTIKGNEDFIDIESCNDATVPVLEAADPNLLLEQFEKTEKLNAGATKHKRGLQINKKKTRILAPRKETCSVSPVHSDHDYCSSKKRLGVLDVKKGQSLLKPEVVSDNTRIRQRSCRNKKIVYFDSDDEEDLSDKKNKKVDKKHKKSSGRQPKNKKSSPQPSMSKSLVNRSNGSVIVENASEACDNSSSKNSIKLIIRNKSTVIINHGKDKSSIVSEQSSDTLSESKIKIENKDSELSVSENINVNRSLSVNNNDKNNVSDSNVNSVKKSPRPKTDSFYVGLFSDRKDIKVPDLAQKSVKRSFEEAIGSFTDHSVSQQKKKKLNLQEYKLRLKGISSNNSSTTVSPEAIFPDTPTPPSIEKIPPKVPDVPNPNDMTSVQPKKITENKVFDPIREASRKILLQTKKQKEKAIRKREEEIIKSKIGKTESKDIKPLLSDLELMKIVGMAPAKVIPMPIKIEPKPKRPALYQELVVVSIGVNTDEKVFDELRKEFEKSKRKCPPADKTHINFKIKSNASVLKRNVFDVSKKSLIDDKKSTKIDKERFKDITATLKIVEKQVDTKITSNSLFASIQDVVMKKAPDEAKELQRESKRSSQTFKPIKTAIVREYDKTAEHGEDKVILHIEKDRIRPATNNRDVQTDTRPEFVELPKLTEKPILKQSSPLSQRENDVSKKTSVESDGVSKSVKQGLTGQTRIVAVVHPVLRQQEKPAKEKRSRSRERYDSRQRRRSRSRSRSYRRRRSRSASRSRRSRSVERYRPRRSDSPYRRSSSPYRRSRSPYRRSGSPYRRNRRSPSPYRFRRSPSHRRDYRSNRPSSRSRNTGSARSKSPVFKRTKYTPQSTDKKSQNDLRTPVRIKTVSECTVASTSSSSASSSISSSSSNLSSRPRSPYRNDVPYRRNGHGSYSSEDRECNTPVEERRIVFVGRLEKDIKKSKLRELFSRFGHIIEVRLHSKEDGSRYGFVTFQQARDAWTTVESASMFPQYDVGFGGRRAFCRQSYADLDGLEATYVESSYHGKSCLTSRHENNVSFEEMLLDIKKAMSKYKNDKKHQDDDKA